MAFGKFNPCAPCCGGPTYDTACCSGRLPATLHATLAVTSALCPCLASFDGADVALGGIVNDGVFQGVWCGNVSACGLTLQVTFACKNFGLWEVFLNLYEDHGTPKCAEPTDVAAPDLVCVWFDAGNHPAGLPCEPLLLHFTNFLFGSPHADPKCCFGLTWTIAVTVTE